MKSILVQLNSGKQSWRHVVTTCIVCTALFCGFFLNQWGAVEDRRFSERVIWFDFLTCGRLAQSNTHGIFSNSGLPGTVDLHHGRDIPSVQPYNCEAYINAVEPQIFYRYSSQVGLQGIVSSIFASLTSFSNQDTLNALQAVTAFTTALILSLLLLGILREYGSLAMIFCTISIISSDIITNFGSSVFWSLWSFYLPLLGITYLLSNAHKTDDSQRWLYWTLIFATFALIKCLFSGYELVTPAFVMMTVPIVYFAVRDNWPADQFLRWFSASVAGALASLIASFAILSLQVYLLPGQQGLLSGLRHIQNRATERTGFESVDISVIDVIWQHLTSVAITALSLNVTFLQLIAVIGVFSIVLLFSTRMDDTPKHHALLVATWFSFLAPMSWFVLFKQHAYHHSFVTLSWYMPFIPLGFALVGTTLQHLFTTFRRSDIPSATRTASRRL